MIPEPRSPPIESEEHLPDETLVVLALEGIVAFPLAERARIHAHLDICDECRGALAEVRRGEEPAAPPPPGGMRLFEPGVLVAERYLIVRYINGGGMGDVYEAEDTIANATIALKTISAVAADEDSAIRRLEREVRTALLVSHPHACRVHHLDVHRLPRGQGTIHFITMELIDGETLAERLKRTGPLTEKEVLELSKQLLGALDAAHHKGVLHRDLKPSNVMLRRGARVDGVVMDFGLAKPLEEPLDARITDSRAFVGSAGYAAPEQLIGDPLSPATDVYAFGVVLFEALTGRLPFESKSAMRAALQRLEQRAPRPSSAAPQLSSRWDRIIGRCLERDPKQRYASAAEVERALSGLRLGDRSGSRLRVAIAVGGLLVVAATTVVLWPVGRQPMTPSSLAAEDRSLRQRGAPAPPRVPTERTEQAQPALTPRNTSGPEAKTGVRAAKQPQAEEPSRASGAMPPSHSSEARHKRATRKKRAARPVPRPAAPEAPSILPRPRAERARAEPAKRPRARAEDSSQRPAKVPNQPPTLPPLDPDDRFLLPGE